MENKILNIIKKYNGIITPMQLEQNGISRTYLSKMLKNGSIDKIDRGIYVTKDFKYDEFYLFQLKYPKTVFSYNSALYLYGMTERTPIKIDVSISKNYNPYRFKNIANVHRISEEIYKLGIEEKVTPQDMIVKTYNLERTVCDIIKDKDSLDIETRNKAIKNCIKNKKFDANKMFDYAKKMKIYDKVKDYMEAIIWLKMQKV